jgi:predicted nucleic acid-binding protein
MILPDSTIWVDHFRTGLDAVGRLASQADILMHPFVLTEIALGSLPHRQLTLRFLRRLMPAIVVRQEEVDTLIEEARLHSTGIGFVDAHLLASARMMNYRLWSRDGRLHQNAMRLGIGYAPPA